MKDLLAGYDGGPDIRKNFAAYLLRSFPEETYTSLQAATPSASEADKNDDNPSIKTLHDDSNVLKGKKKEDKAKSDKIESDSEESDDSEETEVDELDKDEDDNGDGDAATSQKKGRSPTPDKDVEEKHKKQGEVAVI